MKINIKLTILLLFFIVFVSIYFFSQESNTVIKLKPTQILRENTAEPKQTPECNILDRLPLNEEEPELIPANEIYTNFHKDWQTGCGGSTEMDKELYANDVPPMFDLQGPINLVAPDLNSPQRRVNFY